MDAVLIRMKFITNIHPKREREECYQDWEERRNNG